MLSLGNVALCNNKIAAQSESVLETDKSLRVPENWLLDISKSQWPTSDITKCGVSLTALFYYKEKKPAAAFVLTQTDESLFEHKK